MKKIILTMCLFVSFAVMADTTFPRKQLLELFTSLKCGSCHNGHVILDRALSGRTDYVLMAHHSGFADDELTIPYSSMIASSSMYGVTGNPQLMMNRTLHPKYDTRRVFSFAYTDLSTSVSLLQSRLRDEANKADVGITVTPVYYTPDKLLAVTVSLEKNDNLDEAALLSVVLTEDNVKTVASQTGQSGAASFIQNSVLRHNFTALNGDKIKWDNNAYTKTFTIEVPAEWNVDNINAIAFVGMPFSQDLQGSPVFNAESNGDVTKSSEHYASTVTPLDTPVGLDADVTSQAANGTVVLSWNEVDGAENYDVMYQQVGKTSWDLETVDEPTVKVRGLIPGQEYVWKVCANAVDGRKSEYSVEMKFTAPTNSAVENIAAGELVTVVGINGTVLLRDADPGQLVKLPAGFYIVNGRKFIKK